MRAFAYVPVVDLEQAIELLTRHGEDAHLMAGGTALILLLKQGLVEPAVVVGLGGLADLARIRIVGGVLEIGALASLHRVERDPLVLGHSPVVAATVARVATIRIRNQATLGGNLVHADPAQDPPPILLAHDAQVVLRGPAGQRTLPLTEFFVDVFETSIAKDEILSVIRVPRPSPASRFASVKFLPRTVDDYATVSVAVRLDIGPAGLIDDVRIALGNAGAVPYRSLAAEAVLRGSLPSAALIEETASLAGETSDPVDDIRGTAAYKREMVRVWTARALEMAWGREQRSA